MSTSRTIPSPPDATSPRADRQSVYVIVSSLLIVLGFKLLLINEFNPITPFWDQWEEGGSLYTPIIEGRFDPAFLISPHNEHRMLFTRIINLAVFYAVGLWYPALELVVNSFIHCAAIFTVVYLVTRHISVYARSIAILLITLVYIIPFGFENTLQGFQSFYLLILLSVLSIHMMSKSRAFSGGWLAGLALSIASYFCVASGSLTAAISGIIMVLQLVVGSRQRTAREYVAVFVCVAVSVIQVLKIPYVPDSSPYKSYSLFVFVTAMIDQASYPFRAPYGLLQYTPSVILIFLIFMRKPELSAYEWSALAIFMWLGSQMMSIAYGRGNLNVTEPRYTDILILGLSVNLGVAFFLLRSSWSKYFSSKLDVITLLGRWLLALCVAAVTFSVWAMPFGRTQFVAARTFGEHLTRDTENMNVFLRTGDMSVLQGKRRLDVPYPDPQMLAMALSEPTIRSILHPALTGRPLRQDLLLPLWLSKAIRDALLLLMQSGRIVIAIGIGMWLAIPAGSVWNHHTLWDAGSEEGSS